MAILGIVLWADAVLMGGLEKAALKVLDSPCPARGSKPNSTERFLVAQG